MVLGIKRGYACLDCKDVKDAHYACIQAFAAAFKAAHGSLLCRDLSSALGEGPDSPVSEPRTEAYYAERPCETFIAFAADRLERELAR
ncbi:MAG: C-GCAxxG-C-C family (seleno)protein [Atribacter sp.]|uniref:C-GCAxxG-C-C family (seleno)protein n=1 Tax=Atribacter sp. TaxID=2847780 RepID=UPI003D960F43